MNTIFVRSFGISQNIPKISKDAIASYSLRKTRLQYTGPSIRVRRSSDNAEQDIGFSGSNLDTLSLLSFVGANDGYVARIYDQAISSPVDQVQPTTSLQPKIVSSGVLEVIDSRPAMLFEVGHKFDTDNTKLAVGTVGDLTVSAITQINSFVTHDMLTGYTNLGTLANGWGIELYPHSGNNLSFWYGSQWDSTNAIINVTASSAKKHILAEADVNALTNQIYLDGTSGTGNTINTTPGGSFVIGDGFSSGDWSGNRVSELLYFNKILTQSERESLSWE